MVKRDRLVEDFVRLVQVPSLSRHERAMAGLLASRLEALGLAVEEDAAGAAIGGDANNLIAHLPATDQSLPCLLLNAHMDTVPPAEGIRPVIDGDRILSDGTTIVGADDKAGVAVILEVLRSLAEDPVAHGGLDIVFTIAEEIGLHGAKNLDFSRLCASMAYVMDGGEAPASITVAAPYANGLRFRVRGKAAHAGVCPEKGVSAILAAARGIAGMRLGRLDDESTANIGVIQGGEAQNIVPERCEVVGENRSHDEAKLREQTDRMVKSIQAAARELGAQVEIDLHRDYNGFHLLADAPVVALASAAVAEMGLQPEYHIGGGGSDANVFNEHGLPAVILSTGGGNVHTTGEYANIPTMLHAAEWLLTILGKLPDHAEA